MIITGRNRDYKEVADSLKAKRVLLFTCNTCIRLCGNIGGRKAAEDLSEKLKGDGIDVIEVIDVSAACIAKKIRGKLTQSKVKASDVILALTWPLGASSIAAVSGVDVFNPLETIGVGYLDEDGVPIVVSGSCDFSEEMPADEAAEYGELKLSPFV